MNLKPFYFGWLLSFLCFGSNPAKADEKVIHTREVYKIIDSLKLTIDVFHTNQSYEHGNHTAIVFFMVEAGRLERRMSFSQPANDMLKWE